jgi:hypothetical protein
VESSGREARNGRRSAGFRRASRVARRARRGGAEAHSLRRAHVDAVDLATGVSRSTGGRTTREDRRRHAVSGDGAAGGGCGGDGTRAGARVVAAPHVEIRAISPPTRIVRWTTGRMAEGRGW